MDAIDDDTILRAEAALDNAQASINGIAGFHLALLDQKTRRCGAYEARPGVCRGYPDSPRCGYYEFLKFERAHQGDDKFIALT